MSLPLPIDAHIPELVALVRDRRRLVLMAPPGAGKSTRLPPALTALGPVFLLQPRRIAARALARRIALEQGFRVGEEVGWQVRFEREFGPRTRLLLATEGILNARFQADPLLADFATVVLDEFHERSIHADLALAFARQAQRARPDLRIVVMSATLGSEADRVAAFLEDAPVFEVEGRPHPVEIRYAPRAPMAEVVRERLGSEGGHLLCFLPGAREIREVGESLARGGSLDAAVLPLHGSLDARDQDRALAASSRRKVILATNLAETSLTVDGVTDVVDSGLHKVARFDAEKGIDRLDQEWISEDGAAQRAGRAGRTGPGVAIRLWEPRAVLRPHREPDVRRIDLAGPALDVLAWGGDAASFEWFEAPPAERLAHALDLLGRLGALSDSRLSALGRQLQRLPLHPRLARVFVAAGGGRRAAAACAVLAEPRYPLGGTAGTDSDVLSRVDRLQEAPPHVRQVARQVEAMGRGVAAAVREPDDAGLRRALLAGFPDRVARRRAAGLPQLVLGSGQGALLDRESGVTGGPFLIALEVTAGGGPGTEARVRTASLVEPEWLEPTTRSRVHRFDGASGCVRAVEQVSFGGLVLEEHPAGPESEAAAALLSRALLDRGLGDAGAELVRRLRFAGLPHEPEALVASACRGKTCLRDVDLTDGVESRARFELDRLAPTHLPVPSGRTASLEYRDDGSVIASVKLQELFGLADTPRVGPRQEPVAFSLLAPNGRPVQTTRDLRGFWERTYPEVRKELRGRYPRHPWPEDPWSAIPTHRAKPRGGK